MSGTVFKVIPSSSPDYVAVNRRTVRAALPERLDRMLKEKREARKNWQRYRAQTLKAIYNQLERKFKVELAEYRESPEAWARAHRQRLPEPKHPWNPRHVVVKNPSEAAHEEIELSSLARTYSEDEIRFTPGSKSGYRSVIKFMKRIKEIEPDFEYYTEQPQTDAPRYPRHIVVRRPSAEACREDHGTTRFRSIVTSDEHRFHPSSASEYSSVIRLMKRMKERRPDFEYHEEELRFEGPGAWDDAHRDQLPEALYTHHIVVEIPSDYARHYIGETAYRRLVNEDDIRFYPSSVCEYRNAIRFLERIKKVDADFGYYEEELTVAAPTDTGSAPVDSKVAAETSQGAARKTGEDTLVAEAEDLSDDKKKMVVSIEEIIAKQFASIQNAVAEQLRDALKDLLEQFRID